MKLLENKIKRRKLFQTRLSEVVVSVYFPAGGEVSSNLVLTLSCDFFVQNSAIEVSDKHIH